MTPATDKKKLRMRDIKISMQRIRNIKAGQSLLGLLMA